MERALEVGMKVTALAIAATALWLAGVLVWGLFNSRTSPSDQPEPMAKMTQELILLTDLVDDDLSSSSKPIIRAVEAAPSRCQLIGELVQTGQSRAILFTKKQCDVHTVQDVRMSVALQAVPLRAGSPLIASVQ